MIFCVFHPEHCMYFFFYQIMYATQNQEPSVIDSLSGSVQEWYQSVDSAMKKSDIVSGTYEYSITPSYGNVGAIQENASTNLDISCVRYGLISIDNSFIRLKQEITIQVPPMNNVKGVRPMYYIGYQYAPEAIMQYRIYSNSDLIQTVNWANYEWFAIRNSVQPESKEQSDLYATIAKIRRMSSDVPGVYVDLSQIAPADAKTYTPIKVNLDLRIPLNSFLTLRNLKFFPNWAGKLTLEIIPSYKNLVICPIYDPLTESALSAANQTKFMEEYKKAGYSYDFGFHNLNQSVPWKITCTKDDGTDIAFDNFIFKCDEQTTSNVEIHLANYMLRPEVSDALAAQYIQVPLMFPIQQIDSKDYTKPIGKTTSIDNAMTIQLKHADAMFTVFRSDINSYSCFKNPGISFQFNIDGKFYPRQSFDTVEDPRTFNQTLDAMNFNNCLTTSINKDMATSMQPYFTITKYNDVGNVVKQDNYYSADRSNFWIGIPLADTEDFMGGISTNGTVQVQLTGNRLSKAGLQLLDFGTPISIFTQDAILKIRSMKPPGVPQISITHASIEQVLVAAGNA